VSTANGASAAPAKTGNALEGIRPMRRTERNQASYIRKGDEEQKS